MFQTTNQATMCLGYKDGAQSPSFSHSPTNRSIMNHERSGQRETPGFSRVSHGGDWLHPYTPSVSRNTRDCITIFNHTQSAIFSKLHIYTILYTAGGFLK